MLLCALFCQRSAPQLRAAADFTSCPAAADYCLTWKLQRFSCNNWFPAVGTSARLCFNGLEHDVSCSINQHYIQMTDGWWTNADSWLQPALCSPEWMKRINVVIHQSSQQADSDPAGQTIYTANRSSNNTTRSSAAGVFLFTQRGRRPWKLWETF